MAKSIIIGCMALGLLVFTQSVSAQYDYELAYGYSGRGLECRNAVDMDDWLERGRAAVTESPIFPDGIRLTAGGGVEAYEPGLASAMYYFTVVPRWSQYLRITIRYRDAARDDGIAGRLWIKSTNHEGYGALGADEEAPLYGDTFVLRAGRTAETIVVPCSRHVEGTRMEMHIVAEGRDCLDVRDVRVAFLKTRPGSITIVHRASDNYWNQWPRHRYAYHYYYWGPLFWPQTHLVYECWDLPGPFYWITWRPWFRINIIHVHHRHPWWGPRRYTVIYHQNPRCSPAQRRIILRRHLREERRGHAATIASPMTVIRKTVRSPVQTHPSRNQGIRAHQEVQAPRTVETTVDSKQTRRPLQERPSRVDQQRERPIAHTRAEAVKGRQVVDTADSRASRPSRTAPQNLRTDQSQPPQAEQPSPSNATISEAVRTPVRARIPQHYDSHQEQSVQRHSSEMRKETMPQSYQKARQPRSHTEIRRIR